MHPTHSKLYIYLTSNLIYMKGAKSSKILSKYFLPYNDFKNMNN